MKKRFLLIGLAVVAIFTFFRLQDLPKPTAEQLAAAFPGNSQSIFEDSERFILYRLDGSNGIGDPEEALPKDKYFHGYPIIGKTALADSSTRQRIIKAYYRGLATTDFRAACFNPHHGIRAEKNGERIDLVLCFRCSQVKVFFKTQEISVKIGKQTQAAFDTVLAEAGIPETGKQE